MISVCRARNVLVAAVVIIVSIASTALLWAADRKPALPALYRKNKPVVMAFYAEWCGACKQMKPFETALETSHKSKVTWHHIDIETPMGRGLSQEFGINSTPSYLLFRKDGSLAFKHTGKVSPSMLRLQVSKLVGVVPLHPVPKTLKAKAIASSVPAGADFHLVRFMADRCGRDNCKKDSQSYAFFQQQLKAWPVEMAFYQVDTDAVPGYLKSLETAKAPYNEKSGLYYALIDGDGVPLVRHSGPLNPEVMQTIGSAIQSVMAGTR